MFFKLCLALTVAVAIANVVPDSTDKRGRGQGQGQGQAHGHGVGLSDERKPPGQLKDGEGERKGEHGNKHATTTTAPNIGARIAPAVVNNNGTALSGATAVENPYANTANATLPGDYVAPSNSSAPA